MQTCGVWEHAKVTCMCIYNIPLQSNMSGLIDDLHAYIVHSCFTDEGTGICDHLV